MNHRARPLPPASSIRRECDIPDRPAQPHVAPQGRPEQGWPARRCSSEPSVIVIDRLPEAFDPPESQADSADREVAWFIAKLVAAICAAVSLVSTYAGR